MKTETPLSVFDRKERLKSVFNKKELAARTEKERNNIKRLSKNTRKRKQK